MNTLNWSVFEISLNDPDVVNSREPIVCRRFNATKSVKFTVRPGNLNLSETVEVSDAILLSREIARERADGKLARKSSIWDVSC